MDIIATIGPSSSNKKVLNGLMSGGADILRLNFSHFYEDEFKKILNISRSIDKNIKFMADLCGKKIRVCEALKRPYKIYVNEEVYFCGSDVYPILFNGDDKTKIIPLNIKSEIIESNNIKHISMKDGTINFDVIDKNKVFLKAIVRDSGIIRGGKGCNIPEISFNNTNLTDKDKSNLKWALDNKISIISQSYVEYSSEIIELKEYIKKVKGSLEDILIFSKIETDLGVVNAEEIIEVSDGIIIARGDLIPECGIINSVEEEFKLLKKLKSKNYDKNIIIATHVLDSLKNGKVPTINEIESIYNFIDIGINGFLLAGETSIGKYPIETVCYLKKLIDLYS